MPLPILGDGGVLVGGFSPGTISFHLTATGGALLNGVTPNTVVFAPSTTGGVLLNGTSSVTSTNHGGVLVGGNASIQVFYAPSLSGGVIIGGEAFVSDITVFIPSGGVIVGGEALQPSVIVGGAALVTSEAYHYTGNGSVIINGTALFTNRLVFSGTGSITTSGVAKVSVVRYYNSAGSIITSGEARAGYVFELGYEFRWRVNTYISLETSFLWNVGKLPQQWYRIVGKGKANGCPPVDIHDACCQKYILNVHARSVADLCKKLQDRHWKWPIQSVQRFSIPASEKGDCNDTTTVDVCKNALCADFCVDFDTVSYLGSYTNSQLMFSYSYTASGTITTSGIANTTLTQNFYEQHIIGDGGISLNSAADIKSSHYGYVAQGSIVVSGAGLIQSSSYSFVGGVYPYEEDNVPGSASGWLLSERVIVSDDLWVISDISWLQESDFLVVSDFGFDIPAGMNIIKIEAYIERHASSLVQDKEVYFTASGDVVSENLAKTGIYWPIAIDAVTIYETQYQDVSDIGLKIKVVGFSNVSGVIAYIDAIHLKVTYEDSHQIIRTSGSSLVRCSKYGYIGTGNIGIGSTALLKAVYRTRGTGNVSISGQYQQYLSYIGTGNVQIGGTAIPSSSFYQTTGEGEILLTGESPTRSSSYYWAGSGEVEAGSIALVKLGFRYVGTGSILITGSYFSSLGYLGSGNVQVGGEAGVVSSDFHWVASGEISINGSSEYGFGGLTYESYIGFYATVVDLQIVFGNIATTTLVPPTQAIKKCNCADMALALPFKHNMFTNNKIAQFLKRNNITIPIISNLLYNRTNGSWQGNQHYKGFSPNNSTRESWDITYELACTDVIGGEEIGQNVWKFSVLIELKDLITLEEYDTRIIVGFLPDNVCNKDFKVDISDFRGNVVIYQTLLHDDIGLFKTSYWLKNGITFSISQGGIPRTAVRAPLKGIFL